MDLQKYQRLFYEQSHIHLDETARLLLENEGCTEFCGALHEVFRQVHSFKSMAAAMGYDHIALLAHRLEDVVAAYRGQHCGFDKAATAVLLQAVDLLNQQIQAIQNQDINQSLLIDTTAMVASLEQLRKSQSTEDIISEPQSKNLSWHMSDTPLADEKPIAKPYAMYVESHVWDDLTDNVGELFVMQQRLGQLLRDDQRPLLRESLRRFENQIRHLHGDLMQARMRSLKTLTQRYPVLVRTLADTLGKQAMLHIEGTEIELDRAVLDHLEEPLLHMLRNALDHGIESTAARKVASKPVVGQLKIQAIRRGGGVEISLEDDGCGLDPASLRAKAVELQYITAAQAAELSDTNSFGLICMPGFSTKQTVSELSGRGIGMDVVARKVQQMGGSLHIASKLGGGTKITVYLPQTMAIVPVLVMRVASFVFAVPVVKIRAIANVEAGRVVDHVIALQNLTNLLELPDDISPPKQAIILEAGGVLHALGVCSVLSFVDVFVKPLGPVLQALPWYTGAAILQDGKLVLVVDLAMLLANKKL